MFDKDLRQNRKLHILIAEDDRINALVISKFLNKLGHTSECAKDGFQVLEYLEKSRYDIVLMDIRMPNMNGIETARLIRLSKCKFARVPIIALTAYSVGEVQEKILSAGMDGVLSKPVGLENLKMVLNYYGKFLG